MAATCGRLSEEWDVDFSLSLETELLRLKVREFVGTEVLPLESEASSYDEFENIRLDLLERVRDKAKGLGLWAPQMPVARGGLGLTTVERAVFYEEANRSIFG